MGKRRKKMLRSPSLVSVLFRQCRPFTVFFAIRAIIIDSFYRPVERPFPHVCEKIKKIFPPSITYVNSSCTIPFKRCVFGIMTPRNHIGPDFVGGCSTQTMSFKGLVDLALTTTSRGTISKSFSKDFFFRSTFASAKPHDFPFTVQRGAFKGCPLTKFFICYINKLSHTIKHITSVISEQYINRKMGVRRQLSEKLC